MLRLRVWKSSKAPAKAISIPKVKVEEFEERDRGKEKVKLLYLLTVKELV